MRWDELKWRNIEAIDKDLPIVIPLGSIEQHGYHLPLCTDTLQVSAIMDAVDSQMKHELLALPVFWLGSSHHHLGFPGTLSMRPSLYSKVLVDLTESILSAGFRRIFYLNGHGGNETPAAQTLAELAATNQRASASLLALSSWWQVGRPDSVRLGMETSSISHACEYETSLTMFLRPELVELGSATDVSDPIESKWLTDSKQVSLFRRFEHVTRSGNLGRPTIASSAKGQSLLASVVDDIATFIREFARWPLPSPRLATEESR